MKKLVEKFLWELKKKYKNPRIAKKSRNPKNVRKKSNRNRRKNYQRIFYGTSEKIAKKLTKEFPKKFWEQSPKALPTEFSNTQIKLPKIKEIIECNQK